MNKYKTLTPSTFQHICRTCLMHNELFLIDDVIWEGIDLRIIIKDWTPLKVIIDKELPQNMCDSCIKQMYQTYHFLYKCKKSERILKSILNYKTVKDNIQDTKSEPPSRKKNTINDKILNNNSNIEADLSDNSNQYIKEDNLDLVDNHSDQGCDIEVKSETFSIEDQTEEINPNTNIINKIQSIKNQIKNIRVDNKVRLRQMAKAQLVDYSDLPRSNGRPYVFRKGPLYTCITCDSSYQTQEKLKNHQNETKHQKSTKYKCPYCPRKFDACNYRYQEHVRTHTGERPNKCATCGKRFNAQADLKRHMFTHMEVKPYNCRLCSKGFTRMQYLRDHERKHTGEKLLCPFCGKSFISYYSLSHHERTHKGPRDPKDQVFQCHLCGKVLLTRKTLRVHILLHGPKNFSCELCGKTYPSKNSLQNHISITHKGTKTWTKTIISETKFACHLCDKEYKQKNTLDEHLKSHSGQNKYPCKTCGKQFAYKGSLYQHNRLHTGDTKYQCKECLHICLNKRLLESHMRNHTGEKPFVCDHCGKSFKDNRNLLAHVKIHTGEKNHVCKLCDKAFYDTRGLKKHMATHEKNGDDGSIV